MPTSDVLNSFRADYKHLTSQQRLAFKSAARQFVEDLKRGQGFRLGLRVKGVRISRGVFEMTWSDDGCATLEYGTSPHPGDVHIIWRRIGGHEILRKP
jgi:hypothetical protein